MIHNFFRNCFEFFHVLFHAYFWMDLGFQHEESRNK